jgi:hypothetical protein
VEREQPGERPDQGRLATAVHADDADAFTTSNTQVDTGQHGRAMAIADREVARVDHPVRIVGRTGAHGLV